MITVVLDTNVLVAGFAGFLNPHSTPGALLRAWNAGSFQLVVSEPILAEVRRTLEKPYFRRRLNEDQIARAIFLLGRRARSTELTAEVHGAATHPEDDLILATAVSGKAAYLVTGDGPLLKVASYGDVGIVSPRQFLDILRTEMEGGER